jgi:acyl-CoA thioesterase I
MTRFLTLLTVLAVGACSAPHTSATSGAARDSASGVVVASPPEVPDDRPVVVFLGTSLTAGLGLARDEDTFVSRVAELADSAGLPFRAVNAGVSGETSAGGLRRLDWVLQQPFDVLVLELGANDGLRGQDVTALHDNLVDIIERTRTRYPDVKVVLAGMEAPPNLGPAYTVAFHSVFPTVAREEHTALIPFLLDSVAGIPELNQSDGIHPTAEGDRIVARNVWRVLEPVLADLAKSR